jgi:hypothetical protein
MYNYYGVRRLQSTCSTLYLVPASLSSSCLYGFVRVVSTISSVTSMLSHILKFPLQRSLRPCFILNLSYSATCQVFLQFSSVSRQSHFVASVPLNHSYCSQNSLTRITRDMRPRGGQDIVTLKIKAVRSFRRLVSGEHLHAVSVTDLWDKSLFVFLAVYRSVAQMYVQPKRVSCYIFFFICVFFHVYCTLPFPNYCHTLVLLVFSVPRITFVCVDVPTLTLQPIAPLFWSYVFLITQATATRSRVSIMQMSPDGVSRTSYRNTVTTGIPYQLMSVLWFQCSTYRLASWYHSREKKKLERCALKRIVEDVSVGKRKWCVSDHGRCVMQLDVTCKSSSISFRIPVWCISWPCARQGPT